MKGKPWWRNLSRPKVVLPVLLAAALLMVAISLGDLGLVVHRVKQVPLSIMLLTLLLAAGYLLLKGLQLHLLLNALDAHPGRRRFMLAFSVGELALTFPLGIFAQNWVLSRTDQVRFGRSSAATVVMLALEVVVALAWLAASGIPGWPAVRPTALAVLLLGLALTVVALRFDLPQRLGHRVRHPRLRQALDETAGLLDGLKQLARWAVLGKNLILTAAYLAFLATAFWVMGHGMGLDDLSYRQAATIYAFALASILMTGGLFGQIGTMEVIGMSAALATGMGYARGLALMLGFRLAWTGAMWLLNGSVVLALRHSWRAGAADTPPQEPEL